MFEDETVFSQHPRLSRVWARGGERFGPTLAAEHLAEEDGVESHAVTLRRWMLAEGLWSRERKRVLSHDWVVSYGGRRLQLARQSHRYAPAQAQVTVGEAEDGSIEVEDRGRKREWQDIPQGTRRNATEPSATERSSEPVATGARTSRGREPAANHPWRRGYQQRLAQQASHRPPLDGGPAPAVWSHDILYSLY